MERKEKLWSFEFTYLLLIATVVSTSFYMTIPIIAKYAMVLGASLTLAGVVAGLFSVTALLIRPFGGLFADRFTKKKVMICATSLMCIAAFGCSVSDHIYSLVIFRVLQGIGFAINSTATITLVSEKLPMKRLGEGIGWFGISFILATAIGPGIGTGIGSVFGYHTSFTISGCMFLVGVILMTRISSSAAKRDESQPKVSEPTTIKMRLCELRDTIKMVIGEMSSLHIDDLICIPALPLAFFGGIVGLVVGTVNTFIVVFADDRGISGISLYFIVAAISLFAARLISGRIIDRKSLSMVLYPAFILIFAAMLLFIESYSLWVILICAVLISLGQGLSQPALQTTCMREGKKANGKIGVAASTYFIGPDIGQGIGPMLSGAISEWFGFSGMFVSCAVIMALTTGVYAFYVGRRKSRVSQTD